MNAKMQRLITEAQIHMNGSFDPIHDLRHVKRVVDYSQKICKEMNLNEKDRQTVELASWWHDVGRAVVKKPSMFWMLFLDDIISALFLSFYLFRYRAISIVTLRAVAIIFSHSFASGTIWKKIFLRKKSRKLLDILHDADALDVFSVSRFNEISQLSQLSRKNYMTFKLLMWVNMNINFLKLKTKEARKELEIILKTFLVWIKNQDIFKWYEKQFGKDWVMKIIQKAELTLFDIRQLNLQLA